MFKNRYLFILLFALLALVAVPASAQEGGETSTQEPIPFNLDDAAGTVGIQHELETTAEVELMVGDQLYKLNVPVTVQIDTMALLADAALTTTASKRVGAFSFEPLSVAVLDGGYEKDYTTVVPSSDDNVVVVYSADVTNLHNESLNLDYSSVLEAWAVDATGNSYEEEARVCDEVDPGETATCDFIFDVPASATLVDLKVETVAYKQFSFSGLAATE